MPLKQRQEVTDQARVVNSGYREETGLLLGNEFQTIFGTQEMPFRSSMSIRKINRKADFCLQS